jgi:hypothetical protein
MKALLIRTKLAHDPAFIKLALLRLYEQQEDDEQARGETTHENGVGFNKADAFILTPIASQMVLESIGSGIPPEQIIITADAMDECRMRLPKYVAQLERLLKDEEVF